ncbi:hypothetical protein COU36_02425 [Candidatus Micrarchaeota archaeon CG10_big_fil_rev_8_21_14_0_10_59_7]|nr:MAG: hypothetical protein COU36_02425 [Candidatus Micrarchaeota archaeon CG10_big_fil_rev_8_21_14_0_10_59_7]
MAEFSKGAIAALVAVLLVVSVTSTWFVLSKVYQPPVRSVGSGTAAGLVSVNVGVPKTSAGHGLVSINVIDGGNNT